MVVVQQQHHHDYEIMRWRRFHLPWLATTERIGKGNLQTYLIKPATDPEFLLNLKHAPPKKPTWSLAMAPPLKRLHRLQTSICGASNLHLWLQTSIVGSASLSGSEGCHGGEGRISRGSHEGAATFEISHGKLREIFSQLFFC